MARANHTTSIEIAKEYLHFGAAHFTIFGERERENLHGHNFYVTAEAESPVGEDGLAFDYNVLKTTLKALCDELDEVTLLPDASPWLEVREDATHVYARFADEELVFLKRDARCLPVANVTVEELAQYFLARVLVAEPIAQLGLTNLTIGVSSGPGQWARAQWQAASDAARATSSPTDPAT